MRKRETLDTIWEVPDELWERIKPIILKEDPPEVRPSAAWSARAASSKGKAVATLCGVPADPTFQMAAVTPACPVVERR